MSWLDLRQGVLDAVLDLCFPPRCVGCDRRGTWLCDRCENQLPHIPTPRCDRCATPVPRVRTTWKESAATPRTCADCSLHPPTYRQLLVEHAFEGVLRKAIHHLKYRNARHLAPVLGQLLTAVAVRATVSADLVVPVPLHPRRRRERGFNQAELLAAPVAQALERPLVVEALIRKVDTTSQMTLPAAHRRINVADAFRADPALVRGRHVLLIDDVCTTGSTIESATRALARAGAEVTALVLARQLDHLASLAEEPRRPL